MKASFPRFDAIAKCKFLLINMKNDCRDWDSDLTRGQGAGIDEIGSFFLNLLVGAIQR